MAKINKSDRGTLKRVVERRFEILGAELERKVETLTEEYTGEAVTTLVPRALREKIQKLVSDAYAVETFSDAISKELERLGLHATLPNVYGAGRDGAPYGPPLEAEIERLRAADGFADLSTIRSRLRAKKAEMLDQIDVASLTGVDCQSFLDLIPTLSEMLKA